MKHFGRGHTSVDAIVYFPALKTIHIEYKGGGSAKAWTTTREQAGDQLKIDDFGWTSSPLYKGAMPSLYDEMAVKK